VAQATSHIRGHPDVRIMHSVESGLHLWRFSGDLTNATQAREQIPWWRIKYEYTDDQTQTRITAVRRMTQIADRQIAIDCKAPSDLFPALSLCSTSSWPSCTSWMRRIRVAKQVAISDDPSSLWGVNRWTQRRTRVKRTVAGATPFHRRSVLFPAGQPSLNVRSRIGATVASGWRGVKVSRETTLTSVFAHRPLSSSRKASNPSVAGASPILVTTGRAWPRCCACVASLVLAGTRSSSTSTVSGPATSSFATIAAVSTVADVGSGYSIRNMLAKIPKEVSIKPCFLTLTITDRSLLAGLMAPPSRRQLGRTEHASRSFTLVLSSRSAYRVRV
jgi:hypothetical protein